MLMLLGAAVGACMAIVPLFIAAYAFLQRFATKTELDAVEKRSSDRDAEIKGFTVALEARVETAMRGLELRVTSAVTDNRSHNERAFGELAGKVDGLFNTLQLFVNETARSTGALEGKQALLETLLKTHTNG